jgi:hypothetical protein
VLLQEDHSAASANSIANSTAEPAAGSDAIA